MRTAPSASDLDLIARLAEEAISVSPTQLERWRSRGLLPRAQVVREGFGGTRVLPHDEDVLQAAAVLGEVARRSRPWQYSAMALFEEGFTLSTSALRRTASFLVDLQVKPMRRAWDQAEREASPSLDQDEELAEIGERAAALVPRSVWKGVREEITLAHTHASASERREYLDRAMTWRLVDLNVPGRMTNVQRNLARHGMEDPMPVLGNPGVLPLPSERLVVARTLSWGEAETYRMTAHYRRLDLPHSEDIPLFTLMTWIVTAVRRNDQPEALDIALPQEALERERLALERAEEDRQQDATPPPRGA